MADIFKIDVNKDVLSDKVSRNNAKVYLRRYQIYGETIIQLCLKTWKSTFRYGVSQYNKNLAYTMSFNILRSGSRYFNKETPRMRLSLFWKLKPEPLKREGKYPHGQTCQFSSFGRESPVFVGNFRLPSAFLKLTQIFRFSLSSC